MMQLFVIQIIVIQRGMSLYSIDDHGNYPTEAKNLAEDPHSLNTQVQLLLIQPSLHNTHCISSKGVQKQLMNV